MSREIENGATLNYKVTRNGEKVNRTYNEVGDNAELNIVCNFLCDWLNGVDMETKKAFLGILKEAVHAEAPVAPVNHEEKHEPKEDINLKDDNRLETLKKYKNLLNTKLVDHNPQELKELYNSIQNGGQKADQNFNKYSTPVDNGKVKSELNLINKTMSGDAETQEDNEEEQQALADLLLLSFFNAFGLL